ncbi:hypothetical protein [Undibacterium sp. YM2]|uniref:hypothetical protein n=1 Tax=Undibacterium sp. YM2 TaxID=2058625 RepID=UPI00138A2E53|nr:hypothetical protein [Undibacterium sp. YM2]
MSTVENQAGGVDLFQTACFSQELLVRASIHRAPLHRPTEVLYSPRQDRAALHDPLPL